MTVIEIIIGLVACLALYVAVKAHLHHATIAAEVKNQDGKIVAAVQKEVAAVKADITPPAA